MKLFSAFLNSPFRLFNLKLQWLEIFLEYVNCTKNSTNFEGTGKKKSHFEVERDMVTKIPLNLSSAWFLS